MNGIEIIQQVELAGNCRERPWLEAVYQSRFRSCPQDVRKGKKAVPQIADTYRRAADEPSVRSRSQGKKASSDVKSMHRAILHGLESDKKNLERDRGENQEKSDGSSCESRRKRRAEGRDHLLPGRGDHREKGCHHLSSKKAGSRTSFDSPGLFPESAFKSKGVC